MMATLLSYNSSGGDSGRCDAKCYDATSAPCDCICGGRNHGVGETRAIEQTVAAARSMLEEHSHKTGRPVYEYMIGGESERQVSLFEPKRPPEHHRDVGMKIHV